MIVDRYPRVNIFDLVSVDQLRRIDPVLTALDALLADDVVFCRVKADLAQRSPHSADRGRPGTPVEVVLRMLLVRRLYDWSYEETERFVWDSLSLRQFCRIGAHGVPDDTTLIRWAACLTPATMEALNARVVQLACQQGVTRGRKLRVDGTVVETTIHPPSDSSLLVDGVRMLARLLRRAGHRLTSVPPALVRNRNRSARRLGRQIGEALGRGVAVRQGLYRRLLTVTRATLRQAAAVARLLPPGDRLRAQLDHLRALTTQVVDQTTRRPRSSSVWSSRIPPSWCGADRSSRFAMGIGSSWAKRRAGSSPATSACREPSPRRRSSAPPSSSIDS